MRNKAIQTRMREKIRLFPKNYLHEVLNYYELINDCFFFIFKTHIGNLPGEDFQHDPIFFHLFFTQIYPTSVFIFL